VSTSSGLAVQKISASHLERDAYVYIRQSTQTQVMMNTESLARQYELAGRAGQLGWRTAQVVTIDADLGQSGARSDGRLGFKELVADVGLGKVGIVLGIEVSRLARNNADWYQLLDLCALTDTLIADTDGIYHPADFNDRLVLGLKGTMSEAELHLIRSRLTLGLQHKAAKGELKIPLPVGLDYDEDGQVVVSADEAVREAIGCIFRRFTELGSARQVMLSLLDDGVLLPRRSSGVSGGKITWLKASYQAVQNTLRNPAYAGAFVFGQTRTEKHLDARGQLIIRTRALPVQQWAVLIRDHHPGYITWDQYEANLKGPGRKPAPGRRPGRRRTAGGPCAAAGPDPLREVLAGHADPLLRRHTRQARQLPASRMRQGQTPLRDRTDLPVHRRPQGREAGAGPAVPGAGARLAGRHGQGHDRGRAALAGRPRRVRDRRRTRPLRR
jgi:DNA invertase Pin-like site-specific DNA recombinase